MNRLQELARITLDHYNRNAQNFVVGTRDHDVSQNIAALLENLSGERPLTILDFGCGPGRDLKKFTELGHVAIGLEGAERFIPIAAAESGCEVWHQNFLELDLPEGFFDGVYANASLFHVPSLELPRVLRELHATLKADGVLFSSNPHGHNEEGMSNGRYGAFHDLETYRKYLAAAGFIEITHYYRPVGRPRDQQPWLASVWRRANNVRFAATES
jgi:SAM-dependent methyltransferase